MEEDLNEIQVLLLVELVVYLEKHQLQGIIYKILLVDLEKHLTDLDQLEKLPKEWEKLLHQVDHNLYKIGVLKELLL